MPRILISLSGRELAEWRRRAEAARAAGKSIASGGSVSGQIRQAQRQSSFELEQMKRRAREVGNALLLIAELVEGGTCSGTEAAQWLRQAREQILADSPSPPPSPLSRQTSAVD